MDFGETNLKIAVAGLWHLGCVTAACLAKTGHEVIAFDRDEKNIANLNNGKAPLFEPGLDELIVAGQTTQHLTFTTDENNLHAVEIVWVTFDTPVDDNDIANVDFVVKEVQAILPHLSAKTLVVISSQVPVGTTRSLIQYAQTHFPDNHFTFACSPENLRLGKAIQVFMQPDRIVVGLQDKNDQARVEKLLEPITDKIIFMSVESAEMTKHAINSFLATSVVFINELATLCEQVGADASEVERGLKSEERIGPKAYLRAGGAIAGGTLARDVNYLVALTEQHQLPSSIFSALLASNQAHKQWSCKRVQQVLKDLRDKKVVTLGLTYKAGTDTLRRSSAVEICEWLNQQGATVVAFDPIIKQLPNTIAEFINLKSTLAEALNGADAVVVATEWPEFKMITAEQIIHAVKQPFVFDACGFLRQALGDDDRLKYFTVGRAAWRIYDEIKWP